MAPLLTVISFVPVQLTEEHILIERELPDMSTMIDYAKDTGCFQTRRVTREDTDRVC